MKKSRFSLRGRCVFSLAAWAPFVLFISGCATFMADLDRPMPASNAGLLTSNTVVNPPLSAEQISRQTQTLSPLNAPQPKQKSQRIVVVPSGAAPTQRAAFGAVIYSPSRYDYSVYSTSPRPRSQRLTERVRTPRKRIQINPADRTYDVWERIRRGFDMPDLRSPAAERSTNSYAAQPDYFERMARRAEPYLFHIVEEIEKRDMPTELALLPFVESAMQAQARSHANAVGLWQFIPSTGRVYELEQNAWHDQRSHVTESTRAALDYLEKLYDDFDDWHLALAAYNCGEGCVQRALNRARAAGKAMVTYEELDLPAETRGYVPKLQAIKNIVSNPESFGLVMPVIKNEPYFVTLTEARDIDISTAALLAEMTDEEFRVLNPAFKRPVIGGDTQSSILLPADRKGIFLTNLAAWKNAQLPLATWATYTLRGGETLYDVARRSGTSEAALREANRIPSNQHVPSGYTLMVPRQKSLTKDAGARKSSGVMADAADGR